MLGYSTSTRMKLYTQLMRHKRSFNAVMILPEPLTVRLYNNACVRQALIVKPLHISVTDCPGMLECGGVCLSPSLQAHI